MKPTYQSPDHAAAVDGPTVREAEAVLEEWFGAPVVLTSSGRGAIVQILDAWGFNRYTHRVALPRLISACVVTSVARKAFPVDAAGGPKADATLLYHQYGFPQAFRPPGLVIEDICHAFFAGPGSGRRQWAGQVAVFSLPKFIPASSLVGGLVVPDAAVAAGYRKRRDAFPPRESAEIEHDAAVFQSAYHRGGLELECIYLSRTDNPRPADTELRGVPRTTAALSAIGQRRRDIIERLIDAAGGSALPRGWTDLLRVNLPYMFPAGGEPTKLQGAKQTLVSAGIEADLYWIDIDRNMTRPNLKRMLLLPCHQTISDDALLMLESVLRSLR